MPPGVVAEVVEGLEQVALLLGEGLVLDAARHHQEFARPKLYLMVA
jgi:hypothetical protein